jgi:hypothetical protein
VNLTTVGKPEGRKPLGIPRLYMRIILKRILRSGMGGTDWIDVAQDKDRG